MSVISVKVNPSGDIVTIPNLSENLLDPAGVPNGISSKVIIDATTPVAPDRRVDYGEELDTPEGTDARREKLADRPRLRLALAAPRPAPADLYRGAVADRLPA
ncbi:hypothetical protein [Mesorhizobium sp.]|uniref:hypothetical protein n=1 Tax=Mesorhizobium sp. TaxID=1871066 RepID=UPI00257D7BAE|nr:hypothetical protein [Mesorhizobium sp.]